MSNLKLNEEVAKLKSNNIGDRKNAAWILGDLDDKRAVDPLLITLRNEPDRFVRINILKALAKLGDKKALSLISTIKDKDKDTKVRKEASWAYFKIKEGPEKSSTKVSKTIMKAPVKNFSMGKSPSTPSHIKSPHSKMKIQDSQKKQFSTKPLSKPVKIESKFSPSKTSSEKNSSFHSSKIQKAVPKLPDKKTSKPILRPEISCLPSSNIETNKKPQNTVSTTKTIVKMKPIEKQNSKDLKSSSKPKSLFKKEK